MGLPLLKESEVIFRQFVGLAQRLDGVEDCVGCRQNLTGSEGKEAQKGDARLHGAPSKGEITEKPKEKDHADDLNQEERNAFQELTLAIIAKEEFWVERNSA